MADLNFTLTQMSQEIQFSEKESPKKPPTVDSTNDVTASNILQCFVCDAKVQGRHYALATCRTQSTRTRVIEKLGELVGERYMVVISEDDVICRSCANLINTLDRLESEMKGVKNTVLQYLERKYNLDEGELLNNNESIKHSQPPHVAKSCESDTKRKAVNLLDESVSKSKQKKSIWLQCDKCRYTTNYNTFMVHHIRQHVNQKINCDRCGVQFLGNNQQNNSHNCNDKQINQLNQSTNQNLSTQNSTDPVAEALNVECLENGDLTEMENEPLATDMQDQNISIKEDEDEHVIVIDLPKSENLLTEKIETEDAAPDGAQEFVFEQENISDDTKPILLAETDFNRDLIIKKKDTSAKQILTVAEDGTLEMMEVEAWQEKNAISKEEKS